MTEYRTVETDKRVAGVQPILITRYHWRAKRRCRKMNERRLGDTYRYEVRPELGARWAVVAMQNVAEPVRNG